MGGLVVMSKLIWYFPYIFPCDNVAPMEERSSQLVSEHEVVDVTANIKTESEM